MTVARHAGLDCLKLIAAFAVITLHLEPALTIPPPVWDKIWVACRFAVPVFFLISGFFLSEKLRSADQRIFKSLGGICNLFLLASFIYTPWALLRGSRHVDINAGLLLTGTCFHLWFLPSIGFGILCLAMSFSCRRVRFFMVSSAIILFCYILANIGMFPGGENTVSFLRFLSSLPILGIGVWLGTEQGRAFAKALDRWWLTALAAVGLALQYGESQFLFNPAGLAYQFGMGTLVYSSALFMLALACPLSDDSKIFGVLATAGAK